MRLVSMPRSSPFGSISRGEVRVVAAAFALAFWSMTIVVWVRAPIPCGDFICPYTMGQLVHDPARIYNVDTFHAAQVSLVPASASLFYPPVYPPQLAVAMAPFSRLPFGVAVTIWSVIMIGCYALIVRSAYRTVNLHLDPALFSLLAIGFPPFVQMLQYGQNTVHCYWGRVFSAGRRWSGNDPSLLERPSGYCPQASVGVPLAVLVLAGREWRMLAGAVASIAAQAAIVWVVMGSGAFTGFYAFVPADHRERQCTRTRGPTSPFDSLDHASLAPPSRNSSVDCSGRRDSGGRRDSVALASAGARTPWIRHACGCT